MVYRNKNLKKSYSDGNAQLKEVQDGGRSIPADTVDDDEEDDEEDLDSCLSGEDGGKLRTRKRTAGESALVARRETRGILFWRAFLIAVLLTTGAILSVKTMVALRHEHSDHKHETYNLLAQQYQEASRIQARNLFDTLKTLAETVTGHAMSSNEKFPFVTLPMFEIPASHARTVTPVESISYVPFVSDSDRHAWEVYADAQAALWRRQSHEVELLSNQNNSTFEQNTNITPSIFDRNVIGNVLFATQREMYAPVWMTSPLPSMPVDINFDLLAANFTADMLAAMQKERQPIISPILWAVPRNGNNHEYSLTLPSAESASESASSRSSPLVLLSVPVFKHLIVEGTSNPENDIVGFLLASIPLDRLVFDWVSAPDQGLVVTLKHSCGQAVTFELTGKEAQTISSFMEKSLDHIGNVDPFLEYSNNLIITSIQGQCSYSLSIYASKTISDNYDSRVPEVFAILIGCLFAVITMVFIVYDYFVYRRNLKILDAINKLDSIVSTLFPSNVRDRLFDQKKQRKKSSKKSRTANAKEFRVTKSVHSGDSDSSDVLHGDEAESSTFLCDKPIADLYLNATIMFGDIAGFTAWSSVREPSQVFILLETLYRAFDEIAKKRGVFKVETIGDCYVAVTGLPEPRKDHAVVMTRFARDCLLQVPLLTKKLEVTLGPDTGDLAMRIGLHSGPVTAGILRGEKSRFQLFGDTVNTASRMESNGLRNRIQVSQETADLLIQAGKESWLIPREDKINAKGKGELNTFWIRLGAGSCEKSTSGSSATSQDQGARGPNGRNPSADFESKENNATKAERHKRLIAWNVEVILRLLKQVAALRSVSQGQRLYDEETPVKLDACLSLHDEVAEIIKPPNRTFDADAEVTVKKIELDPVIAQQLHLYVTSIAGMYRNNVFHNFAHASHVVMSVMKLLSRVDAPRADGIDEETDDKDYTHEIISDPLTQLACVFSAMIHDVDHPGVSNAQLVKENAKIATQYNGKSVAEQNSFQLAWGLLTAEDFNVLQRAIFTNDSEMKRFRKLVVTCVMATDIFDPEIKVQRKARWEKAFSSESSTDKDGILNRKAAVVLENLIQASDVAHTMQHWQIYLRWNEALFLEMHKAYKLKRAAQSPAEFWYKGELGFFDSYIIPLANKLKECDVFGISSDEYLSYAEKNRESWERQGMKIVSDMIEKLNLEDQKVKEKEGNRLQAQSTQRPAAPPQRTIQQTSAQQSNVMIPGNAPQSSANVIPHPTAPPVVDPSKQKPVLISKDIMKDDGQFRMSSSVKEDEMQRPSPTGPAMKEAPVKKNQCHGHALLEAMLNEEISDSSTGDWGSSSNSSETEGSFDDDDDEEETSSGED